MNPFKMDKSKFSMASMDEPDDAPAYWATRSHAERMAAVEFLRQQFYGYDPATTRLQRVLEVVERPLR